MAAIWPPRDVSALRVKLDELERLLPIAEQEEATSLLVKLLVVRSCGFLEQVVFHVCREYVSEKSWGMVRSFAHTWLEHSRNPSPKALDELVGRFDESLRLDFLDLLERDDEYLKRELAFLVDRRNKIAHGLNEGLGLAKALQLKKVACEIADWFILRFNPDSELVGRP